MTDRIYMDWAATTPLCTESAVAMAPYMTGGMDNIAFGANANSLHSEGRAAFAALESARIEVARCIGARGDEVIFTGGATESDNMALFGIVHAAKDAAEQSGRKDFVPHFIVSAIEHDAVLKAAHYLAQQGIAELDVIGVDAKGFVDPNDVAQAMKPTTVLVSIMLANNEVGSIQPIAEIARIAHAGGALMHTDAVQALGKVPFDCRSLGVDAMSLSAHKICGPKGIGALYLRKGTPCVPYILGGGQESGMRSGTQNVAGAVGFAAAIKACCADKTVRAAEIDRQRGLQRRLIEGLLAHDCVRLSVPVDESPREYLPNIVNVCVAGFESETLILRFDMQGVALSGGSACSSHSLDPSRVLSAIGISRDRALGSLRFSIGRYTTQDDIDRCLEAFRTVLDWKA